MPRLPTVPPSVRCWARLLSFETECPSCGRLLSAVARQAARAKQSQALTRYQAGNIGKRGSQRARHAIWNPANQRLKCPHCNTAFLAGLLLYPVPKALKRILEPPPDVEPTAREIAWARLKAGGWFAARTYERGQPVNVVVEGACSCPQEGWDNRCPVHGDPGVVGAG